MKKGVKRCLIILLFVLIAISISLFTYATEEPGDKSTVRYITHIQNIGWNQGWKQEGDLAGTEGQSLRLEGINIELLNQDGIPGGIRYRTHIQNIGWQDWKENGKMSGTEGKSLRLEGIKIELTGEIADYYDVYYRVHAQNFGWLGWAKNGEAAGTEGYSYRLEAITIKLVKKGDDGPWQNSPAFYEAQTEVLYRTHVQNDGWQDWKTDGKIAGTEGRSLRLEGINIKLNNQKISGGIRYSTHVQNIGWQDWKYNGEMAGTEGQSLRLEAIKIELTGQMAEEYDIYYRAHAQNFGWLGWAVNGEIAGTTGYGYRLEAIEIILEKKYTDVSDDYITEFINPVFITYPTFGTSIGEILEYDDTLDMKKRVGTSIDMHNYDEESNEWQIGCISIYSIDYATSAFEVFPTLEHIKNVFSSETATTKFENINGQEWLIIYEKYGINTWTNFAMWTIKNGEYYYIQGTYDDNTEDIIKNMIWSIEIPEG